jgi:hypothetical protein
MKETEAEVEMVAATDIALPSTPPVEAAKNGVFSWFKRSSPKIKERTPVRRSLYRSPASSRPGSRDRALNRASTKSSRLTAAPASEERSDIWL